MARYFLNCCGARKVFNAGGFILDEIPTVLQQVDLLCSMTPTRNFSSSTIKNHLHLPVGKHLRGKHCEH
jgi:hypothetical protein